MSSDSWVEPVGLPTGVIRHDTREHSKQCALRRIVGIAQACRDPEVVCYSQYALVADTVFPKGSQFAAFRKGSRKLVVAWKWEDDARGQADCPPSMVAQNNAL